VKCIVNFVNFLDFKVKYFIEHLSHWYSPCVLTWESRNNIQTVYDNMFNINATDGIIR